MKRIALIAASSAAAVAATLAMAQPQPIPPAPGSTPPTQQQSEPRGDRAERGDRADRREEWRQRRAERAAARMNERLAQLRTDLKLKPEQVPAFEKLEALIKRNAEQRRENFAKMREQRELFRDADIMERLDMRATRQAERAARSKEMADAVRPLWSTFSDEQKTVARRAVRQAMSEGRERMREMRGRWQEWHGRGDDRHDDDRGPRRWRDRGHDDDDDRG
ncbi:LTXXQ motif family protein [Bosea sp. CRIB-10]|uniref:Spy/CpxP family protein refolding chaperone n=1 Tax=Bosea sp. CRIB-10 TaxID=378404 RepID=UPI0008E45058|nr:Spy/CpxP family protein refolding chaperone [Bosea sp. CRIB-10]SFD37689.1 LTXXQ motif family protein [Bosea sp. CRIB-10]